METSWLGLMLVLLVLTVWVVGYRIRCTKRIEQLVRRFAPDARTVLDLGCGDCCSLQTLVQESHGQMQITGLDVVNKGRCTRPQLFDGQSIPFPDKSFDLGVCAFVLHHTTTQEDLLDELARTCRRILILEDTPASQWEHVFTRWHAKSTWSQQACASCFHSDADWRRLFAVHGLRCDRVVRLPRWDCPFSDRPWFYPVTRHAYLLRPTTRPSEPPASFGL